MPANQPDLMIPPGNKGVNNAMKSANLNQLRSFVAVSRSLNFTSAARQNGVPQSTISRHINDLEDHLGVKLFHRTKKDVRLTKEGQTFLPYAHEILEAANRGYHAVKQLHEGASGKLSISATISSSDILIKALREFSAKHPDIAVDIDYTSAGAELPIEDDDPYDFHFLYTDMIPDSDEYGSVITHTDKLCFVSAKGHEFKNGTPDASSVQDEKFILISEEEDPILFMHVMNYCQTHRFTPHVANSFNDIKSVLTSVSADLGISIVPVRIVPESLSAFLDFTPIDDDSYSIPCGAAWKKSLLNPAARLFLDVLNDVVELEASGS